MKLQCPISKVLIPIDGSEHSIRAVKFSGYLGSSLRTYPSEVALLRVITGRYMPDHVSYVDFRAEILKQSDTFAHFKERHIETNIKPSLDKCEKILGDIGIKAKVEKLILDGDPAHEIVQLADKRKLSTIIMGRRGLSEIMSILLGSITNKVIHSAIKQTVYVVGQTILEDKNCPIPEILIPVDGSSYSMKGLKHAAGVAKELKNSIKNITLLRVINMAFYEKRLSEGIDPEEEAKKIFEEAKTPFLNADIPENLLTMKKRIGKPSEEIIKEAEEGGYNLIIMGRKGRSALKDLILGGVSATVIQRCQDPTIAIVNK